VVEKWIHYIVKQGRKIEFIFAILIVISAICTPFVKVNYDLSKYLPEDVPSKAGLTKMEEEFGYPGIARIMVGPVSFYEAKVYKDRIASVTGVDMVIWADEMTNVYEPQYYIDRHDLSDYYKDEYAVMDVTFEDEEAAKSTHKAIIEIQEILGDKGYLTGGAVQNKSLNETLLKEVSIAMIMGVFMIWLILTITTTTWLEPFLFLAVMGIAILINLGSNLMLGTISFLTFSMGSILQLAIAMDYSIFLLHAFIAEKQMGFAPDIAMENALKKALSSILASGATTVVGFLVLIIMRFSIGRDMGIVLAKGIVISVITVLVYMPALILRMNDRVEKTAHRSFMPSFAPLAKFVFRSRIVVVVLVVLITIPSYVGQGMNQFLFGNSALGSSEGTKVYEDEQEIVKRFGRSNLMLAMIPNGSLVIQREFAEELEEQPVVRKVVSLGSSLQEGVPASFLPKSVLETLQTEKYSRMLIYVKTADESEVAFKSSRLIQNIMKKYYPQDSYLVGMTPSTQDIEEILTKDYALVNILSLIGVALVIMITFRSLVIPFVVMIPIEAAIFINMALTYIYGDTMIFMGYIIVSCLQLGATIDYSILVTNNYIEARETLGKKEAALFCIEKSALSVLTSGSILTIVGYGLFFTSSVAAVGDMGRLIGRGAALSLVLVLFLLPMLLLCFDKLIFMQKEWSERNRKKMREWVHIKQKKKTVSASVTEGGE